MRRWKIDELPQLLNVIRGDMSLVGPRPDVPGFADRLSGADRVVLSVRPGITGPATLAFRDEERLLTTVADPELHNRTVLWPAKVALNREYVASWSVGGDVQYLVAHAARWVLMDATRAALALRRRRRWRKGWSWRRCARAGSRLQARTSSGSRRGWPSGRVAPTRWR